MIMLRYSAAAANGVCNFVVGIWGDIRVDFAGLADGAGAVPQFE
jgi:hypothetical protein